MNIAGYVKTLTQKNAVSGCELAFSQYLQKILKEKCGESFIDPMGNVIGVKKSKTGCGSVMLEAHIDEIGLMIKYIDENGFLYFVPVGGIDPRILPGSQVTVHAKKDYVGIIGAKPPHVMTPEEYDTVLGCDMLYIDVGMDSKEAKENISLGDVVTFSGEYTPLINNFASAKCMDDRASVAILLSVLDMLSKTELEYDLYVCACVQEEVGLRGSTAAAFRVEPDFAIAIDVTHATTPDESKGTFKCGCGPVVCKGPNIHPALVESFITVLKKQDISYEIEIEGGNTGTDAWAIQTAREGIPTMLLSLPLKYMHTPIETLLIDDARICAEAIKAFLESFKRTEDVLCF